VVDDRGQAIADAEVIYDTLDGHLVNFNETRADMTAELTDSLRAMGLAGAADRPGYTALTGGVSSEIWRVDLPSGSICVKRALEKLRVEQDWFAPVDRWQFELAWLRAAGSIVSQAVPKILGVDKKRHLFAMEFLDPGAHRLWKWMLRDGHADPIFAGTVGRLVGRIHACTAGRADIAAMFSSDAIFEAIRIEPYLRATAKRHPDLASRLEALAQTTKETRLALVHGDVSPKNILVGPSGPIFLDAECAWWGDPAFDVAFCLNHLLLKCLWTPRAASSFLACFDSFTQAYLAEVKWEAPSRLESRTAALLPGLLLARIDGKSPVEYITADRDKNRVRQAARALLSVPPSRLVAIRDAWSKEFERA
jgi:aminoglycoside phosphotransferase (APT) family kinase protein